MLFAHFEENPMYVLTWNAGDRRVEATFGGCVYSDEASYFAREIDALIDGREPNSFSVRMDYATSTTMEDGVFSVLTKVRDRCLELGALSVTIVARNEPEAQAMAADRSEQVSSGKEEYVAFGLAV